MTAPTDDELDAMANAWGMSKERLAFLAACPHFDGRGYINVYKVHGPDRLMARSINKALHGSWLPADAAKIHGCTEADILAFCERINYRWPEGCRPRLEWGGATTHNHLRAEKGQNLLARDRTPVIEAVRHGSGLGWTAARTAQHFNLSSAGLYHVAKRLGLRFAKSKTRAKRKQAKTPSV